MRVARLLAFLVALFPVAAQAATSVLLSESFETAVPPAGWVKHSPDGGTGWNRQVSGTTPVPGWADGTITVPPGGGNAAAFATWETGGATANDQWLVSPGVAVTKTSTNLSFWVRKTQVFADNLEVLISTTDSAQASFTTRLALYEFGNTTQDWTRQTINLDAYVGNTVFIAFREFVADNFFDGDALLLDLVQITAPGPARNDFDGDGRSDLAVYYPPGGDWYIFKSTDGQFQTQFGYAGTLPVAGDFDGDGSSDIGAYFPPGGNWYFFQSTDGFAETQFGYAGTIPVVGDFDGDRTSDIGAYFPPGGNWYFFQSTGGFSETQFGYAGTIPVVGDFDGDGTSDIAAYYPPGGNWYQFKSTEAFFETQFGFAGTIPVVGDFDADGRDDIGVYHPEGGAWYFFQSTDGFATTQFGFPGTEPVVGDYDGDGRDDFGVYHPASGNWYLFKSTEGFAQTQFGFAGTIPLGGTLR